MVLERERVNGRESADPVLRFAALHCVRLEKADLAVSFQLPYKGFALLASRGATIREMLWCGPGLIECDDSFFAV